MSRAAWGACPMCEAGSKDALVTVLLRETVGPVEAIREVSLSKLMRLRIAEAQRLGLFQKATQKVKDRFRSLARFPAKLALPRAKATRHWTFPLLKASDLQELPENLRETLLNAKRTYAFFDGDDPVQLAWAQKILKKDAAVKLILTAGDRFATQKALGVHVYADTGGTLTRRFAVTELPSFVEITAMQGRGTCFLE